MHDNFEINSSVPVSTINDNIYFEEDMANLQYYQTQKEAFFSQWIKKILLKQQINNLNQIPASISTAYPHN